MRKLSTEIVFLTPALQLSVERLIMRALHRAAAAALFLFAFALPAGFTSGALAQTPVTATMDASMSLDVSRSATANAASYDLQYLAGRSGPYTACPQEVNCTSTAIGSLQADTEYEAQVRAGNSAGDSHWSIFGHGKTDPPVTAPTVTGATITDQTGTDALNLGDTIQVQVSYSADLDVTGAPRLPGTAKLGIADLWRPLVDAVLDDCAVSVAWWWTGMAAASYGVAAGTARTDRIEGRFHDRGHEEAWGVFDIGAYVGAFGTKRKQ